MKNNPIWFCAGTSGELIKLFPLLKYADSRNINWRFLFTGQSPVNFWRQWDDFRLDRSRAAILIETRFDLTTSLRALHWFLRAAILSRKSLLSKANDAFSVEPAVGDIWIVHGDTLSTVIGSLWSRKARGVLAHVEAGLRSASLFRPFPEEINRRFVSTIARIHFPQDARAHQNLLDAGVKGAIVGSGGNTLYDALELLAEAGDYRDLPPSPYVVANVHRFENLNDKERWNIIVKTLCKAAVEQPVYLVLHPPTEEKLKNSPQTRQRLQQAGVLLSPRMPFSKFIRIIHDARYVISDGGSNQEECAYLGKPCLILRMESERVEGLDASCQLTAFDSGRIDTFLENPEAYGRAKTVFETPPSRVIMEFLSGQTH
jgi:UDP-N-acetylglucosamine 2-epimerase (non-hydrolysing)